MTRRVVIHAGPGKTGTSAIQYSLKQGRDLLATHGVFYPDHEVDSNQVSSGNFHVVLATDPIRKWYIDRGKIHVLLEQVDSGGYHTLLLSSEHFYEKIGQLNECFDRPEFVVYIRNPIESIESFYRQGVKRGGTTRPFQLPLKFNFRMLKYLGRLLSGTDQPRILIRPYAMELFRERGIVSDFLGVVGAQDLGLERDCSVNPSYTLEALEFMRHVNHFSLGRLRYELDRALQACPIGTTQYSLVNPALYEHVQERILVQLDEFIERHELTHLREFRNLVAAPNRRPYREQNVGDESLRQIAAYLRERSPALHQRLAELVKKEPEVEVPNRIFYECFDTGASSAEQSKLHGKDF